VLGLTTGFLGASIWLTAFQLWAVEQRVARVTSGELEALDATFGMEQA
jgi:hypothetical protein